MQRHKERRTMMDAASQSAISGCHGNEMQRHKERRRTKWMLSQ
jgi:hypothetical protein